MFPVLSGCLVRGTLDKPFLQDYMTGRCYHLELIHARILLKCDGHHELVDIAEAVCEKQGDVSAFLSVLEENEYIEWEEQALSVDPGFPDLVPDPYLREVQFDITGKCNLLGVCKHCYASEYFAEATRSELTTEELVALVGQLGQINVARCFLSGGEAFMRTDLPEIIGEIARAKIHLAGIFTNGTLRRPDILEAVSASQRSTIFLVSLDGQNAESNDFIRGRGCFDKTITFIRELTELGFRVTVNTMVTKRNVTCLMTMCSMLEDMGIFRWRLSIPREQGEAVANWETIIPDWADIFTAYRELVEHGLTKTGPMKLAISSIFKTELSTAGSYHTFHPAARCCDYKHDALVIKPNGNIVPCAAFDDLVLGNVRNDQVDTVWRSDLTQAFKTLPVCMTECGRCDLSGICGSGCRKMAYEITGDPLGKDPSACPLYGFVSEEILPLFEKHGISPVELSEVDEYQYDPDIIRQALKSGESAICVR